jgi:hypothetical protein
VNFLEASTSKEKIQPDFFVVQLKLPSRLRITLGATGGGLMGFTDRGLGGVLHLETGYLLLFHAALVAMARRGDSDL